MSIKKSNCRTFFILFFIFSIVFLILPSSFASTMIIEVLPPQPMSGQNFTISVYDPNITDDTPYLTNVQITFLNNTYFITDDLENRELQLSAPTVHSPTKSPLQASRTQDYLIFFLLAIVSGLLGHTLYNWSLKYIPASIASVALLGEPLGSSVLAMMVPWINQTPTLYTLFGGIFIFFGELNF